MTDSSIQELYATTILVKQLNISEKDLDNIESYLQAVHALFNASSNESSYFVKDILSRDDAKTSCPELFVLSDMIKDEIRNLAVANIKNHANTEWFQTPSAVTCTINNSTINILEQGRQMELHTHFSDDAFACFYFQDIEEEFGGTLKLHDPRWQRSYWFGGSKVFEFQPKRGTVIIAPNFIWHEVTTYTGKDPRLTYVLNAHVEYDKTK